MIAEHDLAGHAVPALGDPLLTRPTAVHLAWRSGIKGSRHFPRPPDRCRFLPGKLPVKGLRLRSKGRVGRRPERPWLGAFAATGCPAREDTPAARAVAVTEGA
jgi:hypothetical protein